MCENASCNKNNKKTFKFWFCIKHAVKRLLKTAEMFFPAKKSVFPSLLPLFLSFLLSDRAPGRLAAQGQRRYGSAHLLHVPHRPLPLHVLDVWPPLRYPALQCTLPPAILRQPGQLLHPGAAGLLVCAALQEGLPSLPTEPRAAVAPRRFPHHRHPL